LFGCARECAEARGKDFGIIAIEHGWNLYLGGNGGFRPRRPCPRDLSTVDLTRSIDGFLMFYIRNAQLSRVIGRCKWVPTASPAAADLCDRLIQPRRGVWSPIVLVPTCSLCR
jgi:PadR family transcriptional regulator PadR